VRECMRFIQLLDVGLGNVLLRLVGVKNRRAILGAR